MRGRRALLLLGIAGVALAIGVRAALPMLLARYVNRVLDRTEGYTGHIEDLDLSLWRGAYTIEGLRLDHEEKEELRPLIAADRVDLSVEWSALLHGSLVGEVDVSGFVYNVVAAPPADDSMLAQTGEEPDLAERLSQLFPFSLNRLEIHDGQVHYRDPFRSPRVDIALTELHLLATNWSNVQDREGKRFARAWVDALAFGSGRLVGSLEANPLMSPPDFVLALAVEGVDLRALNDFLRAYGGFDVDRGRLAVYTEVTAEKGRFQGYLKPVVSDLDVLGDEQPSESWPKRIWEGVVGAVAEVFQNQFVGRQATRIPLHGEWGDPAPNLIAALGNVFYNAFIEALPPRLEHPARLEEE